MLYYYTFTRSRGQVLSHCKTAIKPTSVTKMSLFAPTTWTIRLTRVLNLKLTSSRRSSTRASKRVRLPVKATKFGLNSQINYQPKFLKFNANSLKSVKLASRYHRPRHHQRHRRASCIVNRKRGSETADSKGSHRGRKGAEGEVCGAFRNTSSWRLSALWRPL